ncbi:ROK family transcriptional regulator [Bacillus sp. JJ1764]|uniref:ROK family transcriptional regulator n=1 Tax=Bacillus sp. JJ1764 TaxID=3122964 RepID=UPI002FFFFAD4
MSELFATPKTMKKIILSGIRTTLLKLGSATKVELTDQLGISFPTISKFLEQMEKDGEILLLGLDDSSGGRRAKRYSYNPDHMLGLAIYLERTETHYTVFNCLGEVKKQGKTSSVLIDKDLLTTCIEDIMVLYPKISALAIGVPGSVENGRVFYIPGYEHFQDFDLKGYYEDHFSIPVVVENDMNASVLGYHNKKGRNKNQSLVYLYFGQNGPGAGILINGDVVRGSTFFSGEVSFVPLYDQQNFIQSLETEEYRTDAISRLVAAFVAIINPHTIIFCVDEMNKVRIDQITEGSSKYIPAEHLPEITMSDWKQDYLHGLQKLGLDLMITEAK